MMKGKGGRRKGGRRGRDKRGERWGGMAQRASGILCLSGGNNNAQLSVRKSGAPVDWQQLPWLPSRWLLIYCLH